MANMTFKASLIPNTDFGYSLGSEEENNIKRWTIYGKIRRSGVSTNWNKGRDNAVAGTSVIDGYSPAFTVKTTNGSWDIGAYNSTNYIDDLVFSYVPDTLYNGTNAVPTQIKFLEDGHIVASLDGNAESATKLGADNKGSATKPIYLAAGVPTECTTYAGGTAVTLNGTSKAGSTASFYAPTASGTASTQALVSGGANTAPAWTNISPSITITAGTSSAAPKVNVTVLGQSGTSQSITTASTSVYGCTKLTSSYTSDDSTLAATGASIASAIGGLDVSSVGGTGKYISAISQTDGKISATATNTSVSNSWTAGTTAGPKIATTVNGVTGTAVAIPTATASASGAVTTGDQTWAGSKTFNGTVICAKTQDASGVADNKPALIVGGASTAAHIEMDGNEILAKSNGTTPSTLWLQDESGTVGVAGTGGLKVTSGRLHVGARDAWNKGAIGCWIGTDGSVHLSQASGGGYIGFHFNSASATTSSISEIESGGIRVVNRLIVNNTTSNYTLNGASTTSTFTFAVAGNGFVRDTFYTNAAFQVRGSASSTTSAVYRTRIYDNGTSVAGIEVYSGTTSTAGWARLNLGNSTASGTAGNSYGVVKLFNTAGGSVNVASLRGALNGTTRDYLSLAYVKGTQIWGAVWNDYAEFRKTKEQIEPGRCVIETGKGDMILSTERLQNGAEIISDTFGFAIGQNEQNNAPIAVSGRVLAYLYEDKEYAWDYIGYPVCSGPEGTVSIMTEEEASKYPWKIIGTISEIPNYEKWQIGEKEDNNFVDVNNRIWIRIK